MVLRPTIPAPLRHRPTNEGGIAERRFFTRNSALVVKRDTRAHNVGQHFQPTTRDVKITVDMSTRVSRPLITVNC